MKSETKHLKNGKFCGMKTDTKTEPATRGKSNLTTRIMLGLACGIVAGMAISYTPENGLVHHWLMGFLELIGGLFINSIKMLVVPLVFVSLLCGVASLGDINKLGRIGAKTLGFYLLTTAIAISLALALALAAKPGSDLKLAELTRTVPNILQKQPFSKILQNIIPSNPVAAMAEGNMLQIIFFALLTGISITIAGQKARPVGDFFDSANIVIMQMVMLMMSLAPFGVFALIAQTFATTGFSAMLPLLKYMGTVIVALLLHICFIYLGALKILGRLNPIQFIRNFLPAMSVAFSTASSNGTLPVTIETVEKRCGVSSGVAAFTLPLGATINMDGTAIMQGVAVVFIAQIYGIDLSLSALLTVILTATMASIGTAGVPGVGLITLSMVLESVNLPIEGIALIIGVDRLLDMARTVVNITGDAVCTVLVAKSEGEFDQNIFDAANEGEKQSSTNAA